MTTALQPPPIVPDDAAEQLLDVTGERLLRLSVEQYHSLIGSIVPEDNSYELLGGLVVRKMGKNGPHCVCINLIRNRLWTLLTEGWSLRLQDPITLSDSEPEPDLVVARGNDRDYLACHPTPSEIGLLIEVADTTFLPDRKWKRGLYARNGIEQFWLVNLAGRKIEVCRQPDPEQGEYLKRQDYSSGQSVPVQLDDLLIGAVPVDDVLP